MISRKSRKLSWGEVQEVRKRYEDEDEYTTIRGLAKEYGISKSAMHRLLRYETYKEPLDSEEGE